MVDQEVVNILAEIKERVGAARDPVMPRQEPNVPNSQSSIGGAAAKADYSGLTVLSRAWNRLPPVASNRSGAPARLELWIKSKLQRMLRWLTWEQVNFNAATHQMFLDVVESLATQQQQIAAISKATEELELLQQEVNRDITTRHHQTRTIVDAHEAHLLAQRSLLATMHAELNANAAAIAALEDFNEQVAGTKSQLEGLINEIRERDERVTDEQRVCFKQLSIELTELQTLMDRARRDLDARMAKLEAGK